MTLSPLLLSTLLLAGNPPRFTPEQRAKIVTYWNTPGRYAVAVPDEALKTGPWQVRLTPDGSTWFLAYQIAIGAAKAPPTTDVVATAPDTVLWETWVTAKLNWDRWVAQKAADAANLTFKTAKENPQAPATPPVPPGPIPVDLREKVGNPPAFANIVTPLKHIVTFEDGDSYAYPDNVLMRPRYAYYRFPQGTVAYGTSLKQMSAEELGKLYEAAGFTPFEQHVAEAVSKLEGGFETVNTYDTGYISIGFIQFITADTGKASLCEVMAKEKADKPEDYEKDFRNFGLDVNADGFIVAIDPATGADLTGAEAVKKIIEDKRLTAIFQKAGKRSQAFRVAQIQVAKSHYWPADDPISIMVEGNTLTGKVSDVVKSEAGMATLFDRKVNRGRIDPFAEVLTKVMTAHNLTSLADATMYEREIIAALKYRTDYLADTTLSQPK